MRSLILVLAICLGGTAIADDDWAALEAGGAIALMRHALAPGTGDPAGFRIDDCATQRNLDAAGRDQARRVGKELRARSIQFDRVWTSQWCRCRETAVLLDLGAVTEKAFLNSFFAGRGDRAGQTRALREALAELPRSDRSMVVTHQVNISALTGGPVRSGEIVVVRRDTDGDITVTGRILVHP